VEVLKALKKVHPNVLGRIAADERRAIDDESGPIAMNVKNVNHDRGVLDGQWATKNGKRLSISNLDITWVTPPVRSTAITKASEDCNCDYSIIVDGISYSGKLDAARILWDNGDIWTKREVQSLPDCVMKLKDDKDASVRHFFGKLQTNLQTARPSEKETEDAAAYLSQTYYSRYPNFLCSAGMGMRHFLGKLQTHLQTARPSEREAEDAAACLSQSDVDGRRDALRILQEGQLSKEQIALVAEYLCDDCVTVRASAARVLQKQGNSAATFADRLAEMMNDTDAEVRFRSLEALESMGTISASYVTRIAGCFIDEDQRVRSGAIDAMIAAGSVAFEYVDRIAAMLRDSASGVRKSAARALSKLPQLAQRYVDDLAEVVRSDDDESTRGAAAQALGAAGEAAQQHSADVRALFTNSAGKVRRVAAQSLVKLRVSLWPEDRSSSQTLFRDDDFSVRMSAIASCKKDNSTRCRQEVVEQSLLITNSWLLEDDNYLVRGAAAAACTDSAITHNKDVEQLLGRLLKDDCYEVRQQAAFALASLGAVYVRRFKNDFVELSSDSCMPVRNAAITTMCKKNWNIRLAIDLMHDPNCRTRQHVITSIAKAHNITTMHLCNAAQWLPQLLEDSELSIRRVACTLTCKMIPALRRAHSLPPNVLPASEMIKKVATLLRDPCYAVRNEALQGLLKHAPDDDVHLLLMPFQEEIRALCGDPNGSVQEQANQLLNKLCPTQTKEATY